LQLLIVIFSILLLDQVSKALVQQLMHMERIEIIESILYLTYVENPGAAFGILPYRTTVFIVVTLVVVGFILYYMCHLPSDYRLMRLGLAMQLAGALGNMIDRIRIGYVIDFIQISFWPVFNVADIAIVAGIILFIYSFWKKEICLSTET